MGLLNDSIATGLTSAGLGNLTSRELRAPYEYGPDFPEGFKIIEYVDGREAESITFLGAFMPLQPFKFGGKQQIVKEYYPGNSEPTVQILGPREDDVTINGRMKTGRIQDEAYRSLAQEMQKQTEAMRIRGNLVKIKLGDWYRYAFIESANFDLNLVTDIRYEITFTIVGFNIPKNSMFLGATDENPQAPNKELIAKGTELLAASNAMPESMPQSISDIISNAISEVAESINLATSFVDGIISDAEALNRGANRALGLIKNARSVISQQARRIGQIEMSISNLGGTFVSEAQKTASMIRNANHIHAVQGNNFSLMLLLADLQNRFRSMITTLPYKRHLVRDGDTLQKISILYFNTSEYWEEIKTHNKLATATLEIGKVLEIPRI